MTKPESELPEPVRFQLTHDPILGCHMHAHESGDWVTIADCRSLLAQREERIRELETTLDAWQSVFQTSQLSHAQARLERAEAELARMKK